MMKIPLTRGLLALIDDDMYDRVSYFKWHARKIHNTFYAISQFGTKKIKMHQLIMGFPYSHIDHKDNDGLNNTVANLRHATNKENGMNRRKQAETSSQYKGVSWNKKARKWQAYISVDRKRKHLYFTDNETSATIAYNEAAIKYFGEFARLNIVK